MTNKFKIILLLFLVFNSCEKQDDNYVPENLQVNNFIWKGLNLYYLWQADEPDLADNRFGNQTELNNFLTGYSNPNDLFQHLLNKPASQFPEGEAIDRFSVLFSDYSQLEGILSGTTLNDGMDFGLKYKSSSSNEIFGWVRYVLPNSDAANKNVLRGMIFYGINGTTLTDANYRSLLNSTNYTINLADYDNGNITPNGQSIILTKSVLSENPVYLTKVIDSGNKKIGYLMYNGFYSQYESQLNQAFGQLKSQGVTDLVLDLRYNSGGSISTAGRLASMITGRLNGQIFGKQQWNAKAQAYFNQNNPSELIDLFPSTIGNGQAINSLNLNKVYVLTSKSTASASELVINGLEPYISVIQIGDVTVGKNVGSITLYDSPTFTKSDINTKHKYAMQPLVLKITNKNNFGDYINGLQPDELIKENYGNLGILGETTEPLLNAAITKITTGGRSNQPQQKEFKNFKDSKSLNEIGTDMYLEKVPFIN
jgi:C-terminal processing protease CtpA/Prc